MLCIWPTSFQLLRDILQTHLPGKWNYIFDWKEINLAHGLPLEILREIKEIRSTNCGNPQGNPKWIFEDSKIPYWHPWSTLVESHGKPLKSIRGSWSDPTGIIEKSYAELVDPMLGSDASFEKPRALSICHWLDDSQANPENPNWFLNNVRCNINGDPSIPQGHV